MSKHDKMMKALEKNLPEKIPNRPIVDKDIKDDYEFSRATYKDLIRTGTVSYTHLTLPTKRIV